METVAHQRLKRLAAAHLRGLGCQAVATEVGCPIARYRVDVAGYVDAPGRRAPRRAPSEPWTVLIECKQSREDFLRDGRELAPLLDLRAKLQGICRSLEEKRVKVEEPHLRTSGSSLFGELEAWDFSESQLPAYRRVLRSLRRLDQKLYGETKFCMIARYHLADRLYIAAPRGLIRRRELPAGWGLLECPPWRVEAPAGPGAALVVAVEAPPLSSRPRHRHRLLRNIAVAASRAALRRDGAAGSTGAAGNQLLC